LGEAVKVGDVVEATWEDHCFVFKDYSGEGVMRMRTLGWFVKEDENVLCIALTLGGKQESPNDVQVIDKRMLISRRKVR
jgi:hypothetical protein